LIGNSNAARWGAQAVHRPAQDAPARSDCRRHRYGAALEPIRAHGVGKPAHDVRTEGTIDKFKAVFDDMARRRVSSWLITNGIFCGSRM
jgi:hypothetical protein